MYVREFYELINELDLNKDELKIMKKIINTASKKYVKLRNSAKLDETERLEFIINGWYIERTTLLDILKINVYPKKQKEYHINYENDSFSQNNIIRCAKEECKTKVSFPTTLLSKDEKEKVLERIKLNKR